MKKRILASLVMLFITISILGGTGIEVSAQVTDNSSDQIQNVATINNGVQLFDSNPSPYLEFPTNDNKTKGTINNIVIFVAFKDETTTITKEQLKKNAKEFENLFNGSTDSLRNYTSLISENQLTVNSCFPQENNGEVIYYESPYTLEEVKCTYLSPNHTFLKDILKSVNNKIPSNLNVDINGDGYVDNITYVFSHEGRSFKDSLYFSNGGFEVNSKRFDSYNVIYTNGFKSENSRIISHEFLHSLGFPDMYDEYERVASGWCFEAADLTVMASEYSYPSIHERVKYGKWISEPKSIVQSGTYTISARTADSKSNVLSYKIPVNGSDKFFIVEYINENSNSYEKTAKKSGLAIFTVNPLDSGNMWLAKELYFLRDKSLKTVTNKYFIRPLDGTVERNRQDLYFRDGSESDYYIQNVVFKDDKVSFDLRNKNEIVIDEFKPTTSQGSVGENIKFTTKASGGIGDMKYSLQVRKGTNNFVEVASGNFNSLSWQPMESGSYDVKLFASDAEGHLVPKTITYTVLEKKNTTTTIYYKGYTNPYIHYRIGSGVWTNAPGVKMEACTDVPGYNYKATIELGQEQKVTACFNNGSGSWDSNSGANYTFATGNYTFQNGTITPITVNNKLTISNINVSFVSPQKVGTKICVQAEAMNYKTKYRAIFTIKKNNTTVETLGDSISNEIYWTPKEAGNYTITAYVHDAEGNIATKTINYIITESKLEISSINIDKVSPQKSGTEVKLDVIAKNYKLFYDVSYVIQKQGYSIVQGGSIYNGITISWQPKVAGIYTINATVKDADGNTATKTIEYTITEAMLTVASFTVDKASPQKVGTALCFNVEALNYNTSYGAKFTIKKDGTVVTTLGDYTSRITYWTPSQVGAYTIIAEVRDALGNIATKTMEYTIISNQITENKTTIYYKGYTNPYIHYRVGNGAWTSAPGVKMTADSNGYYKIIIDLGTADTLTACFNNGSGTWDSNSGANYMFKVGTYYYYNKIIQTTPF